MDNNVSRERTSKVASSSSSSADGSARVSLSGHRIRYKKDLVFVLCMFRVCKRVSLLCGTFKCLNETPSSPLFDPQVHNAQS